jgi:hypothetical protein
MAADSSASRTSVGASALSALLGPSNMVLGREVFSSGIESLEILPRFLEGA